MTNILLQEADVAFDRTYEYAHLEPKQLTVANAVVHSYFIFSSLAIDCLHFRFPGRQLQLENVSLTLKKSELVAIIGESGCGKSTLLQLIQRFYTPEAGQLQVNDTDWNAIHTTAWRQALGVVPQQVKLFSGTLLDNICLNIATEEAKQIITFCQQYGFSRYFETFPQGYLTLLGEDGIAISGGQRQLVALARALYQKPQLLLLDELTAAMDKNTERFVLNLLNQIRPQIGLIMITHKPQTAYCADRVYQLEQGKLSVWEPNLEETIINDTALSLVTNPVFS